MEMKSESKGFAANNQLNAKEDSNGGNEGQKYKIKRKQIAKWQKYFLISKHIKCKWIEVFNQKTEFGQ